MLQQLRVPVIALSLWSMIFVFSSLADAASQQGRGHGKHTQQEQLPQNDSSNALDALLSVQSGGANLTVVGTARELATTYQVSQQNRYRQVFANS